MNRSDLVQPAQPRRRKTSLFAELVEPSANREPCEEQLPNFSPPREDSPENQVVQGEAADIPQFQSDSRNTLESRAIFEAAFARRERRMKDLRERDYVFLASAASVASRKRTPLQFTMPPEPEFHSTHANGEGSTADQRARQPRRRSLQDVSAPRLHCLMLTCPMSGAVLAWRFVDARDAQARRPLDLLAREMLEKEGYPRSTRVEVHAAEFVIRKPKR